MIAAGTDIPLVETTCFQTFEDREAAFNAAVGHLIPGRYRGPRYFWRDFNKVTGAMAHERTSLPAYITSNPRDCLAFGTAEQVLAAATMYAGGSRDREAAIAWFGLEQAGRQPIRSLSGGETVRLALAKVMLAATRGAEALVIASPFCWLSRGQLPLLHKVLDCYAGLGKPVCILAMQDEESLAPMSGRWLKAVNPGAVPFDLELAGLHIQLGMPVNALTAKPVLAGVADFRQSLVSPCLVTGDNGQGKSVLAKALCGAAITRGLARITTGDDAGRARLLFQDVITQTLLRSPEQLARDQGGNGEADAIFNAILAETAHLLRQGSPVQENPGQGLTTLLAVKAMLIAVRLAARPAALFLDEPDWGLTRTTAIAFVLTVVRHCHRRGVPVLLVSHKPWWPPMANSLLTVEKTAPPGGEDLFGIVVRKVVSGFGFQDSGVSGTCDGS